MNQVNVYGKEDFAKVNAMVLNNVIAVIMGAYGRIPNATKQLAP